MTTKNMLHAKKCSQCILNDFIAVLFRRRMQLREYTKMFSLVLPKTNSINGRIPIA